jgi:NCS1 family nucleobase:cation symporter-1
MAFFTGFGVSALIYFTLNKIWPSPGAWQSFEEVDESEFQEKMEEDKMKREKDRHDEDGDSVSDGKGKDKETSDEDVKVKEV